MITLIAQKVDIFPGDGSHPHARTGQLSFFHLKRAGAKGILIGHSEAGESIEEVNKKLHAAFEAGLKKNIVLLGEEWKDLGKPWHELSEANRKHVKNIVEEKCLKAFEAIGEGMMMETVVSYEPGWGVKGSGKSDVPPPPPEQIEAMAETIRNVLVEKYGEETGGAVRIIYGGSTQGREEEIMPVDNIDGFILGSAGTKTEWVKQISQAIIKHRKERTPVLALNWKAYELEEGYDTFLKLLKPFEKEIDIYIAPPATELNVLNEKIKY